MKTVVSLFLLAALSAAQPKPRKAPLPDCPGLPNLCAGLLVPKSQAAKTNKVIQWYGQYIDEAQATQCRFIQPPRCFTGQVRACKQQCTK